MVISSVVLCCRATLYERHIKLLYAHLYVVLNVYFTYIYMPSKCVPYKDRLDVIATGINKSVWYTLPSFCWHYLNLGRANQVYCV